MFYHYGLLNSIIDYKDFNEMIFLRGTHTNKLKTTTVGLWGRCITTDGQLECADGFLTTPNRYAMIISARVFVTIACILSSFSILSILLILLVKPDSKRILTLLTKVFTIGSLIAGILGVAIAIIFVLKDDQSKLAFVIGVSGILGIIAVVFNLAGTIASFLIN